MTGSKIPRETPARRSWYLLIHQLPPKPLYLRAKVRQRLERAGAIALKNSVYVLPRRPECLEALVGIGRDARDGGGEAYLCEASFPDDDAERLIVERFRANAGERYRALGQRADRGAADAGTLSRLTRRFDQLARIDFFESPAGAEIARRIADLRSELRRGRTRRGKARPSGRNWFTRRNFHIDRIASAWLIRRFLDPQARFRFGDAGEGPARGEDEISFDVPGGDYTHEEDRCTFETLIRRHDLADPALRHVAEIVHDVDLKDGKFGRPEAIGVERVLAGILSGNPGDPERLARGFVFFEDLYRSFAKPVTAASTVRKRSR